MTPERKEAIKAFGRYYVSEAGRAVFTDQAMQKREIEPVAESESWSVVVDELQGKSCVLAVHRADGRFDLVEMIPSKVHPLRMHRDTTVGVIIDAMTTLSQSGYEIRRWPGEIV